MTTGQVESPSIDRRPSTKIRAEFGSFTNVHGAMINSSVTAIVYDSVSSTTPLHVVCDLAVVEEMSSELKSIS